MHNYGASSICMNIYEASDMCMNIGSNLTTPDTFKFATGNKTVFLGLIGAELGNRHVSTWIEF